MIDKLWGKTVTSLYNAYTGVEALHPYEIVMLIVGIVAVVVVILLIRWLLGKVFFGKKPKEEEAQPQPQMLPIEERIGKVHHIGKRPGQQDSLGVAPLTCSTATGTVNGTTLSGANGALLGGANGMADVENSVAASGTTGGVLAVVSDGMGGLADGDKVSQKVVMTMLSEVGETFDVGQNSLYPLLYSVNRQVNQMLGQGGRSSSGATLIAVLQMGDSFHWVTVGDSRIYLFCNGRLLQMNREHVYAQELTLKAINGEKKFEDVTKDAQRKSLTSYIGMGKLKYVEGSTRAVPIAPGDRILLMSDGVFNTLSEAEICEILKEHPGADEAARALEDGVLAHDNPKQDNFTAIILNY